MKAYEIINKVFTFGKDFNYTVTCDTLKAGSADKEVKKLAVNMNPTVDVIKQAHAWGADMLITHEPLYYNHMDDHSAEPVECEKRALLESTGMTVYRFHDHPHRHPQDMIATGEFRAMDLDGELTYTNLFDTVRCKLNAPMTAVELAKRIEEKLKIKHIRIAGARDKKITNITACFGAPGDQMEEFTRDETEVLIMGETCEWRMAEYARDAAALGKNKTLLVLGHAGSERAGMEYITDCFKELLPELEIKYFETDEVYTYTD
ncbi:MAG: Nif3-like dinuclear metal center hexameric protein [Clostridia bacterium]|nr:Nif3-like dinuclear metal center hexameric protein [Clostridia bacterium]